MRRSFLALLAVLDDAAIEMAPGETMTLDYTFDQPGELLIGCHEPGHYEGGMVGTIEVQP